MTNRRNRHFVFVFSLFVLFLSSGTGCLLAQTLLPLLSFTGAKEGRITIEAGKQHLLHIHYERDLDWSRFKATAEGKDVTRYFHPMPQTAEPISVPLAIGDNHLKFEVGRYPDKRLAREPEPGSESEVYELQVRVIEPAKNRVHTMGVKSLVVPPSR